MSLWLTMRGTLVCKHKLGKVGIVPSQRFVTISGSPVLVEPDPVSKSITGCPNVGATIKPCTATLAVTRGYSGFIRINGQRVCLEAVTGLTDGTPPGMVEYNVASPGQGFVSEKG